MSDQHTIRPHGGGLFPIICRECGLLVRYREDIGKWAHTGFEAEEEEERARTWQPAIYNPKFLTLQLPGSTATDLIAALQQLPPETTITAPHGEWTEEPITSVWHNASEGTAGID